MAELFAVFDVPSTLAEAQTTTDTYRPSPSFDVGTGDFNVDGAGKLMYCSGYEAWVLWCTKTVVTQRWAHLGYRGNIGAEIDEAFSQPDRQAQQSYLERTITEALLADPKGRTVRVYDFAFSWLGDELSVNFTVLGADGDTASISADYNR